MPKQVEFFYDFTSPTAYLAWRRLPAIAQRTGAKLAYVPVTGDEGLLDLA